MTGKYDLEKAKKLLLQGKKLKEVSEKLNINYSYLAKLSSKKGWAKKGKNIANKIEEKTTEKTIERISDKLADRNAKHIEVWDLFLEKLVKQVIKAQNKIVYDQFGNAKTVDFNPRDLAAIAEAVERVQRGQRLAEGVLSEAERQKLELERQKVKKPEDDPDKPLRELAESIRKSINDLQ